MPREDWDTEETGILAHFMGQASKAFFSSGEYGPQFNLEFAVSEVYDPPVEARKTTCWYSLGGGKKGGWVITEGGRSVEGPPKFHARSKYGMLIKRVTGPKEKGGLEFMSSAMEVAGPKDATVWEGLGMEMVREPIDYGEIADAAGEKREVETTVVLPVRVWEGEKEPVAVSPPLDDTALVKAAAILDGVPADRAALTIARHSDMQPYPAVVATAVAGGLVSELEGRGLVSVVEGVVRKKV